MKCVAFQRHLTTIFKKLFFCRKLEIRRQQQLPSCVSESKTIRTTRNNCRRLSLERAHCALQAPGLPWPMVAGVQELGGKNNHSSIRERSLITGKGATKREGGGGGGEARQVLLRLGKLACPRVNDDHKIDVGDQKLNSGRPHDYWTLVNL